MAYSLPGTGDYYHDQGLGIDYWLLLGRIVDILLIYIAINDVNIYSGIDASRRPVCRSVLRWSAAVSIAIRSTAGMGYLLSEGF